MNNPLLCCTHRCSLAMARRRYDGFWRSIAHTRRSASASNTRSVHVSQCLLESDGCTRHRSSGRVELYRSAPSVGSTKQTYWMGHSGVPKRSCETLVNEKVSTVGIRMFPRNAAAPRYAWAARFPRERSARGRRLKKSRSAASCLLLNSRNSTTTMSVPGAAHPNTTASPARPHTSRYVSSVPKNGSSVSSASACCKALF
mmetsp:Transcript_38897/g.91339  ORF Transcript_38897/g.91339 Transcript_38897/m.91339 type:complete len:200 (-) Transcript_38897:876-1475(-)